MNLYAYWYYSLYHLMYIINPCYRDIEDRLCINTSGLLSVLQTMVIIPPVLYLFQYLPIHESREIVFFSFLLIVFWFYRQNQKRFSPQKRNTGLYEEYKQMRTPGRELLVLLVDVIIVAFFAFSMYYLREMN